MKKKIRLPNKIVIASFNKGKLVEIKQLFKNTKVNFIAVSTFTNIAPDENGKTFTENALIKARSANKLSGLASIADDSGLCINALNGAPGIFSSRWAGTKGNFDIAIKKVFKELNKKNKNWKNKRVKARFVCALSICWPGGKNISRIGKIEGFISYKKIGKNGFGYDPIFIPKGSKITFAQMSSREKFKIDHRSKAFQKIKKFF